jgi:adenylate kinase family enzyme
MQRVVIVGASGAGKSTLAESLAQRIKGDYLELDALYWLPGWQRVAPAVFVERVTAVVAAERWVVGSHYNQVRDLVWMRADTIVWLDYAFPVVFTRLLRRTVRRIVTKENLWGTGNYESWRTQFLVRKPIFLKRLKTYIGYRYRNRLFQILEQPGYTHLQLIRLKSPSETERWLESIEAKR